MKRCILHFLSWEFTSALCNGPCYSHHQDKETGTQKAEGICPRTYHIPHIALYKDNNNNNNKNAFLDLFSYSESQPTDNEFVQVFNISCMIFSFVQCMLCVYVCVRVHI